MGVVTYTSHIYIFKITRHNRKLNNPRIKIKPILADLDKNIKYV